MDIDGRGAQVGADSEIGWGWVANPPFQIAMRPNAREPLSLMGTGSIEMLKGVLGFIPLINQIEKG